MEIVKVLHAVTQATDPTDRSRRIALYSLLNLSRVLGGPLVFAIPRDNLQRIEKPTMRARALARSLVRSLAPLKTIESIETIET